MPKQEGGPPDFRPDELLYRRVLPDWVDDDGNVTAMAIEIPAFSVDREAFTDDPQEVLRRVDAEGRQGVAACSFETIPDEFSGGAVVYESVVAYCPEEGIAHSEVRVRRKGKTEQSHKPQEFDSQIADAR